MNYSIHVSSAVALLFPYRRAASLGATFLAVAWLLFSSPLAAQSANTGGIEGRALDASNGAYLGNVVISIEGSARETLTDENGYFRFSAVPAGRVNLRAAYIGLDGKSTSILVEPGRVSELNFELVRSGVQLADAKDETVKLESYTVIEDRERSAQTLALNQQRQSPNIKNVVAYDEYPTGSDDNIADFIRFIPGVSIGYSGKAGISASLRGMPAETSGITIDGVDLAGSFTGDTRAVSLLAVPTTNISTIEVTKVPTPDMAANGLGGSINITTRSGFERSKPLLKYNVFSSFNPEYGLSLRERVGPHASMDSRHLRPSFEFDYLLPVNKSFSVSLSAANKLNYNTNLGTTVGWNQVGGFQSSSAEQLGTQLVTVRSARLGVDWKLGAKDIFNASVTYRGRDADQGTNGLSVIYGAGASGGPTFTQGAANGVGSVGQSFSWQNLVSHTTNGLLKYKHLGEIWRIDASASYSYSKFYFRPTFDSGYFGTNSITIPNLVVRGEGMDGAAARASEIAADSFTIRDRQGNPVDPYDGRGYTINTASTFDSGNIVDKSQLRLDLRRDFKLALPFSIQTGAAMTQEMQKRWNLQQAFNFRPTGTAADRLVGNYDLINTSYSAVAPAVTGGQVQWIDLGKLYDLYRAHPEYFVLNEALAHQTRVNNSKKVEERISALYFRADTRLLRNRLWLVGGVRYERTDDEGWGPSVDPTAQYVKNADGTLARNGAGQFIPLTTNAADVAWLVYVERGTHQETKYDGFFPSLNASYNLKDDLVVRFGYARTIGRPNLPFIIPGVTYSTITPTTTTQVITVINNRLEPWEADNYDLSLETYMIKGGFGSIGVFQKNLANFFTAESFLATPELLEEYGVVAAAGDAINYEIRTRGNGGDARVRGLEFTYKQELKFLPNWARGLQVFVNYTRSQLSGSTTADFTGFNPETLSWGVNLTRPRYAVKFSSSEQGETKRAPVAASTVTPADTYQWQGAQKRYTISFEYSFSRRLGFYASFTDFNHPGGYTDILKQYAPSTPENIRTTRVMEWGVSAIVGIKGQF
jgi:iron complex outermembrane receptor protein